MTETVNTEIVIDQTSGGKRELVFSADEPVKVKEPEAEILTIFGEGSACLAVKLPDYNFEDEPHVDRMQFVNSMVFTMRMYQGAGLSANQVGNSRRMFVMQNYMEKDNKFEILVCFNPEIIRELEPPKAKREGCLSFPGLTLQVKRPEAVEVSFQDEGGKFHELELSGFSAQCFQHELDHLNGVVFTSKVSREIMDWERNKQRKIIKKMRKNSRVYQ